MLPFAVLGAEWDSRVLAEPFSSLAADEAPAEGARFDSSLILDLRRRSIHFHELWLVLSQRNRPQFDLCDLLIGDLGDLFIVEIHDLGVNLCLLDYALTFGVIDTNVIDYVLNG